MFDTRKLNPFAVIFQNVSDKGWAFLPEVNSYIWIVKNSNGNYSSPYIVKVVASVEIDANDKGCLVYVTTNVDDYFDHVSSSFDIIGTSEADVRSKAASIYNKHKERAKSVQSAIQIAINNLPKRSD